MAHITFIGVAQEVTGSYHLLESPALGRVLLDCGMHQGGDYRKRFDEEKFKFDPKSIDAVILSHAHLDHSGLLPKLVRDGFNGDIFCTHGTRDLLKIMLEDSVNLYLTDFDRENRYRLRKAKVLMEPLYTREDVDRVLGLCRPCHFEKKFK